jgi:hypothetical protein
MLAITHNAQFRAVKDVLKSKGLSLEGVKVLMHSHAPVITAQPHTPQLNRVLAPLLC